MEDLIFLVLFVAIPTIILTMAFIAVLKREERAFKRTDIDDQPPRHA